MSNKRWIIKVTVASIIVSMIFSFASSRVLQGAGYISSLLALVAFVFAGVICDMIGVAVTAAVEAPFHSMAAHNERGAVEAIRLIKNAEKVSSVCNDIGGDISGIVSGATAALIATRLAYDFSLNEVILQLLISGAVTGLMIAGKAVAKLFALYRTNGLLLRIGKIISIFSRTGKKY